MAESEPRAEPRIWHPVGYAIDLVTATVAAVSIGIGIDFAIHFTARYREQT